METVGVLELIKLVLPYVLAIIGGLLAAYKSAKAKEYAKASEKLKKAGVELKKIVEASVAVIEMMPEGEAKENVKRGIEVADGLTAASPLLYDIVQDVTSFLKQEGWLDGGNELSDIRRMALAVADRRAADKVALEAVKP